MQTETEKQNKVTERGPRQNQVRGRILPIRLRSRRFNLRLKRHGHEREAHLSAAHSDTEPFYLHLLDFSEQSHWVKRISMRNVEPVVMATRDRGDNQKELYVVTTSE